MGVTALVMAGGPASRMAGNVEKPLLKVCGKTMLEHVIQELRSCKSISRIVVAATSKSKQTARKAVELDLQLIETPGSGYEPDMRFAVKKLGTGANLVISADLPFVTSEIIEACISRYYESGRPALSVSCPLDEMKRIGASAHYVFEHGGEKLVPVGINILNGIKLGERVLDEEVFIVRSARTVLNVNNQEDLALANKLCSSPTETAGPTELTQPRRNAPATLRVARVSVLSALSVVGSFIHLPSPVQTVALDSAPGFFAALLFGPLDGCLASAIGHLATAALNGAPLGFLHIPIAAGLAIAGASIGFVNRIKLRQHVFLALSTGVSINTLLFVLAVPALGWAGAFTLIPFLLLAAGVNASLSGLVYRALEGKVPV